MATWSDAAAPPDRAHRHPAGGSTGGLGHGHHRHRWDAEQADCRPGLQEPTKKAVATLDREWDWLAAHCDYPMISLDNDTAERMIRGPAVTWKNVGGFRNGRRRRLAAVI
jgi:hypothetical protein